MDPKAQTFNTNELILFAMIVLLFLALSIVLIFIVYHRRIVGQQKEHQKKELDYQNRLLHANLLSQEKERNRIAKNLHDDVGALLTTIKLYIQHMHRDLEELEFLETKKKTQVILNETITAVRRVSFDLKPVVLERLGLAEALNDLALNINDSGEVKIIQEIKIEQFVHNEFELNWYRIVKELINNTIKHANASIIILQLIEKEGLYHLSYCKTP